MPSYDEVVNQVRSLDSFHQWLNRKELRELPSILWEDEQIKAVTSGTYEGGTGLLVATDRRVLFVDKGMFGARLRVEDFGYDKITSIQYATGMILGKIVIFASGNKAEIVNVQKDQAKITAERIRLFIGSGSNHSTSSTSSGSGMLDELERLAALHSRGILTEAEFAMAKIKLLQK